ncbi:MAG: polymerase sigma-70 factor, subfamily [Herbinix sp.]|jgi:RNA polymerase sigma-70 factor (ECF subfamily)|nr:polymerase sigma-70 factor, subfamily [Herbinix sp.]
MDNNKIIDLYWERSEEAIKETAIKYGNLCKYVASNILYNTSDIEECLNDTLLGAWNAIPPARPELLSSFSCRITGNLALKKYEYMHAKRRNPKVLIALNELDECTTNSTSY